MANYITETLTWEDRQTHRIYRLPFIFADGVIPTYDCDVLPRDAEDIAEAAWGMAKAAREVHGRYFNVDSAYEGDHFNAKVPTPHPRHLPFMDGGTDL